MIILAIDPGPVNSGFVQYCTKSEKLTDAGVANNNSLLILSPSVVVIEKPVPRGNPLGHSLLDTIFWTGIYTGYFGAISYRVDHIRTALVGRPNSKDSEIRAYLLKHYDLKQPVKVTTHAIQALAVLHYHLNFSIHA